MGRRGGMGGNPMNEKVGIKNFRIDVQHSIPPSPSPLEHSLVTAVVVTVWSGLIQW